MNGIMWTFMLLVSYVYDVRTPYGIGVLVICFLAILLNVLAGRGRKKDEYQAPPRMGPR